VGDAFCFAPVLLIGETGESGGLGPAIHIKKLPRFLQDLNQLRTRDAITDAQTGESLDFRKRAEHGDVPACADETKSVRGIVEVFEISFIENDDDVFRDALDKSIDL